MRRDVFQAIADPTRREIITMLANQPMTPNLLAGEFKTSRQAISKHIKILVECKMLKMRRSGREIYYFFNPDKMKEIDTWLEQFRMHWENRFSQLDKLLVKLNSKRK
jgi:DNA-binding transcriptional ArsR family regulator